MELVSEYRWKRERSCCIAKCVPHVLAFADRPQDLLPVIDDAERQGLLHPYTGSRIFEGTVGSTGISIATIARARYFPSPTLTGMA